MGLDKQDWQEIDRQISGLWTKAQKVGLTRRKFLELLAVGGATAVLAACTKATPSLSTTSSSPKPATTTAPPILTNPYTSNPFASTNPATTTTAATPAKTTTPTPVNTTVKPKYGGTLTVANASQYAKFGVPWLSGGPDGDVTYFTNQNLLFYSDQFQVYEPVLAESWQFAPDKSSLTFKLRKGIKFTDGTPFNAEAVSWFFYKNREFKGPTVAAASAIGGITLLDDYTVRYDLRYWTCVLLDQFWGAPVTYMSPTAYEKYGEDYCLTHPVGTGPWLIKDYSRGQYVKFIRNPNYWRNDGSPYFNEIDILYSSDVMVGQASIVKGDFHVWSTNDPNVLNSLESQGIINERVSQNKMVFQFNSMDPKSPWSDLRMRQALEYAIDKETIVNSLLKNYATPAYDIIPALNQVGTPRAVPRKYDPAKAKQLMTAAGWGSGITCTFKYSNTSYMPPVTALQAQLAEVGINATLQPVADQTFRGLQTVAPDPNEIKYVGQSGGFSTLLKGFQGDWSNTSLFYVGTKKPDNWQANMDKLLAMDKPADQVPLLEQMDKEMYDTAMLVPLWISRQLISHRPEVISNMPPHYGDSIYSFMGVPCYRYEYGSFK